MSGAEEWVPCPNCGRMMSPRAAQCRRCASEVYRLTDRNWLICEMLDRGRTRQEVAARWGISVERVRQVAATTRRLRAYRESHGESHATAGIAVSEGE